MTGALTRLYNNAMSRSEWAQYDQPLTGDTYTPRPTVSFGDDKYAQKTRAWLAREQWEDYQARFQPYETKLMDAVTGEQMLDERLGAISVNNRKAFAAATNDASMLRQRYGIQQGAAGQTDAQKNLGIAEATTNANARNLTRRHTYDRNMNTIAGSGVRQALSEA